jgi:hypothetical protein
MTATLLLCVALFEAGPLSFTGTASIYSEYGFSSNDSLMAPGKELRFNINPSLSLWNFPIGLNMLVSAQENPLRQQLDKFKLFLNPRKWLESQANLSGFALSFKSLELGSCNPSWTSYTLSGAPVFGGAVELNPWYIYAAAAAGRNQRRVDVTDASQGAYGRMLYSGRFGFGKKEGTHFYFTALHATDDAGRPPDSVWQPNPNDSEPPIDSFEVVRPQENYVLGAEFNLDLAKGAFRLESEITGCEVTRDKRANLLPNDTMPDALRALLGTDTVPGWVMRTFKPRYTSSFDFAFKVRPVLNVLDTRLYGQVEMVGPGFQSFGAPGLRNDNLAMGGGIERSFFDNAVSVSAAYNDELDNLLGAVDTAIRVYPVNRIKSRDTIVYVLHLKSATSRFTSWETNLSLAFPNLPYVQLGYYPYTQASVSFDSLGWPATATTTMGRVVSVSAGHSFQTGKLSHSPGVSFSYNDLREPTTDITNSVSWDAGVNYGLGFESPLSLSASAGYSNSVSAGVEPDSRIYFDVTPSYTFFEKWSNSLSIGGTFLTATRIDLRYSSSFPIWKICDGSVGISDAIYSGDDGSYNDLRLTAELSKSW